MSNIIAVPSGVSSGGDLLASYYNLYKNFYESQSKGTHTTIKTGDTFAKLIVKPASGGGISFPGSPSPTPPQTIDDTPWVPPKPKPAPVPDAPTTDPTTDTQEVATFEAVVPPSAPAYGALNTLSSLGKWATVASNGTILCTVDSASSHDSDISADGVTWESTSGSFPISFAIAMAVKAGTFCAIAAHTDAVATGTTGLAWTSHTLPVSAMWGDIAANTTRFCVVAQGDTEGNPTNICVVSYDGVTFIQKTLPALANWSLVLPTATGFCAIGTPDYGVTWYSAVSINHGDSWELSVIPDLTSVGTLNMRGAVGGGVMLIVSADGLISAKSLNGGVSWSLRVSPMVAWGCYKVAWNGTIFYAIPAGFDDPTPSFITSNGDSWQLHKLPPNIEWTGIAAHKGKFCVTSSYDAVANADSNASIMVDGTEPYFGLVTITPQDIATFNVLHAGEGITAVSGEPTFLVAGSFDELVSAPVPFDTGGSLDELTAPPLPFHTGGSDVEHTSAITLPVPKVSSGGLVQHSGLPFVLGG
jgi:hypothetical protein